MKKLLALLNTPARLVFVLGSLVLTVELLIMEVIHDVLVPRIFPEVYWGFVDTALLTIIVSPALYFLVFRKIHESEERFRQINASAQDAIVIINEQGMVTDWNLAAQKMFQYSREEAVGQQMHQLIAPPRLHADAARGFARFQETGAGPLIGKTTELPALRKDGSEFYIEQSISAIKVQSRWHAIGIMRDITERKQAEDKLAKSERHFRAVTESANDAIITGAGAGNIVGWNAAAGRIFGYTEAEMIGQPLTVLIPERFRNQHSAGLARVVAGGTPHIIGKTAEVFGLRKDGSEFPLELSLAQWQAADGQFFTAIIRDITERKGAEESVRISQARLRTIFNQAPLGIALIDSFTGQIYGVNPRFAEIAGRTIEEMATIDWMSITHPDDVQEALDNMALLNAGKIPGFSMEKRYIRPDGSFVWINMTIAPLSVEQNISPRHLCMIDDITERKQAEAKLAEQLDDLRRWHDATIGREMRVLDLKHEVNELLGQAGQPPRYPSAESDNQQEK